jgi:hypothetical protein
MTAKTPLILVTLATTLGLSGPVMAAHLNAPDGLVCETGLDNSIHSDWNDRDEASSYAVEVTAEYDVSKNGQMDRTQDFRFGSEPSELVLQSQDMMATFIDDTGKIVEVMPMAANLQVKALHLGKGHETGNGHEKAIGEGHQKMNGSARNAEAAECRVTLSDMTCPFNLCF